MRGLSIDVLLDTMNDFYKKYDAENTATECMFHNPMSNIVKDKHN